MGADCQIKLHTNISSYTVCNIRGKHALLYMYTHPVASNFPCSYLKQTNIHTPTLETCMYMYMYTMHFRRHWQRRVVHKAPLGKEGSIKSRLMCNQPITIELDDSDSDLISPTKK